MVEWVAQGVGNGCRPLLKFFVIGLASGAIVFRDAIGAHGPPFVVVAVQPGLGQVVKAFVFGNLLRWQVVVVINDGHFMGILVVEQPRRLTLQQKILGEEGTRSS